MVNHNPISFVKNAGHKRFRPIVSAAREFPFRLHVNGGYLRDFFELVALSAAFHMSRRKQHTNRRRGVK